MTTLRLSVPEELFRRASARLGKAGRGDVQEFLVRALQALSMDEQPIDRATERKLLEGLDSPLIETDDAHWRAKLRRYDSKRRKPSKGRRCRNTRVVCARVWMLRRSRDTSADETI